LVLIKVENFRERLESCFPRKQNGSLASRFAYHMLTDIHWLIMQLIFMQEVPAINAPQIRLAPNNPE
jgi:hypothetical protein